MTIWISCREVWKTLGWLHVKNKVEQSANKYTMGIFIDFSEAFDHLEWDNIFFESGGNMLHRSGLMA